MTALADIRAGVLAFVNATPGVGVTHGYQRYAHKVSDFKSLYAQGEKVLGFFITRTGWSCEEHDSATNRIVNRWTIRGFMALEDEAESEVLFDQALEAMRQQFNTDETLGGVVDTTIVDGRAGLQLESQEPVMFAGILCHQARLTLSTVHFEDVGATDAIDDFLQGGVAYDLAQPDGVNEAEDLIEPEQ
ncbi:MAG: hypothetical protein RIB45_17860 [Marivibrio sp.]|uniref:hypothetical protein n=1 Tax=Marivibrio sp. TaxID=2039719 RepID=UPI0032F06733